MCKRNSNPGDAPDGFQVPLDKRHIEAARAVARWNKGIERRVCESIGRQVGDQAELRDDFICILVERGVPIPTLSDAFGLSWREVWKIVSADPVSLFDCLECTGPLPVRDRGDLLRLKRALDAARNSTPGEWTSPDLFCGVCTEITLRRLNEQLRRNRLAEQARFQELDSMSYNEYLATQEWKATKAAALAWARHRCQMCNTNGEELHVHHRVYAPRGRERPGDLTVLCRTHHAQFHGELPEAS